MGAIAEVQVVHRVRPDGNGYRRIYAALDRLIPDTRGLERNRHYAHISASTIIPDRTYPLDDTRAWENGKCRPTGMRHGVQTHVVENIADGEGGYLSHEAMDLTPLLSAESDTRNPHRVVVRSSVFSKKQIKEALRSVA